VIGQGSSNDGAQRITRRKSPRTYRFQAIQPRGSPHFSRARLRAASQNRLWSTAGAQF
jgi:hypothetical protein